MGKFTKIVLTGGPCAGKTTALQKIQKEFTEKGYIVFIVGESATEMILAGAKPFGDSAIDLYKFQTEILKYQLFKEAMYERFALSLPDDVNCLIVCDRGALDNRAYIGRRFDNILADLNLNEIDILTSYKMIIHLVTAANGALKYYTLANNGARSESPEEAIRLDNNTLNCWIGHPNLQVIANNQSFDEKLDKVIKVIHRTLGMPVPIQRQQKFLVDHRCIDNVLDYLDFTKKLKIESIYVDAQDECCLKKFSDESTSIYYEIHKKDTDDIKSRIKTERKINEKEYLKAISKTNLQPLVKNRYSFVYDNQYFKLDVFSNGELCMLEVEYTEENNKLNLPPNLRILDDVTNDLAYRNFELFQSLNERQYQKVKR